MKTFQQVSVLLFGVACLAAATGALGDARTAAYNDAGNQGIHVHVAVFGDEHIHMDRGDVVITADDGTHARITPEGNLLIQDKTIDVSANQHALLKQYNRQMVDIEDLGLQIGRQGANLALGVLGDLFAGLMTGDLNDRDLDRKANFKAQDIETTALSLCHGVKNLQALQGQLAGDLPTFRPYAVIEQRSIDDCYDGAKNHHHEV